MAASGKETEVTDDDDLDAGLDTTAAARVLGYAKKTIARWRSTPGKGPDFYRASPDGTVRYRKRALIDWQTRQEKLTAEQRAARAAKEET